MVRWAASMGIIIPLPGEQLETDFFNQRGANHSLF